MKQLNVPQSGSQADTTASRNRYGQYLRTRRTPVNPNTVAQSAARGRLAELSALWQTLTDEQRSAWRTFADSHPRTDGLGSTITLTGHQAYVSVNSARRNAGMADVDVPGAESEVLTSFSIVTADDGFDVTFTATPVPANHKLVIEASAPTSPGRSFENDFRFITALAAATATGADILAAWESKFGAAEDYVGKKVFFRAYLVGPTGDTARIVACDTIAAGA